MPTLRRAAIRRLAACAGCVSLALSVAGTASADYYTFKRAVQNIVLAPVDLALSPVTAGYSVYSGLRDIDDSPGVRIVYPVPGYVWNLMVNIGAAAMRETAGLFELIPGILLLPFDAELDPIYAPVDRADALVDEEYEYFWFKFGVLYTSPPSY